jgi:signal transduction histidine kinase
MHGWGQWYGLAVLVLAAMSYLLGRRGAPWIAAAVLGCAEAASIVAVIASHDTLGWLGDQAVIVLGGVFCVLAGSYRRLRHELTAQGWARAGAAQTAARLRERARLAAELHDTVGHELTLLSLRAGGIQVTTADPAVREQAAALRGAAADAITTVRRLVDVLGEDASGGPGLDDVLRRQRAAGMTVHVEGELPADASEPVRRATGRVVAQALANAAQHAYGEPVRVAIGTRPDEVSITVTNPCPPRAPSPRAGSGLAAMGERLRLLGGVLRIERGTGEFRLAATMPRHAQARVTGEGTAGPDPEVIVEYGRRRRRARGVLVASVAAPLAALVILSSGFYAWAVRGATLEEHDFRRLRVGMTESEAATVLPGNEARLRFAPAAAGCRFYTNGNYPLAYGNYEVCFLDGRISVLRDRTGNSP